MSCRGTSGSARINSSSINSRRSNARDSSRARPLRCLRRAAAPGPRRARSGIDRRTSSVTAIGCRQRWHTSDNAVCACSRRRISGSPPATALRTPLRDQATDWAGLSSVRGSASCCSLPISANGHSPCNRPWASAKACTSRCRGSKGRADVIAGSPQAVGQCVESPQQCSGRSVPQCGWDNPGMSPVPPLILASTSRYRHELLSRLRLPFEVLFARGRRNAAGRRDARRAGAATGPGQGPRRRSRCSRDAVVIGSDQVADLHGAGAGQARLRTSAPCCSCAACAASRCCSRPPWRWCASDTGFERALLASVTVQVPRSRATPRSSTTCAPSSPTTAPAAPSARRWASPAQRDRIGRSDRADRPAADPHLRAAAPGRHRPAAYCRLMTVATGQLLLVPNTLDLGTELVEMQQVLPLGVLQRAAGLAHWLAEDARSTRAFLKRVHAVVPLAQAAAGDRHPRTAASAQRQRSCRAGARRRLARVARRRRWPARTSA